MKGLAAPYTLLLLATALLAWLVGGSGVAAVAVSLLPLAVYVSHYRGSVLRSGPTVLSIVIVGYFLFFPLRGAAALMLGQSLNSFGLASAPPGEATEEMLAGCGLAMTALVLAGCSVGTLQLDLRRYSIHAGRGETSRWFLASAVAFGIAFAAVAYLAYSNGGFAPLALKFARHSKDVDLTRGERLTLSAWTTFAPLAIVTAACGLVARARIGASRSRMRLYVAVWATPALVVLGIGALSFGSRKMLLAAAIPTWIVMHHGFRRTRTLSLLVGIPLVAVASLAVVSNRVGPSGDDAQIGSAILENLGHSVLDASVAADTASASISPHIQDVDRWFQAPLYLVPSVIWPGKPTLDHSRVDVVVADAIGGVGHDDTGFPTGFFLEWKLLGGWPVAIAASALFGAILGAVHRWVMSSRAIEPVELLLYGRASLIAFGFMKDGDVLASIIGAIKQEAYVLLLLWVCGLLHVRRTRGKAAPRGMPAIRSQPVGV